MLLSIFNEIPDHRSVHGRMYGLNFILFFSILAILSGADSYRKIRIFMFENFNFLKKEFDLKWRKPPSYTGIRKIILGVDSQELETAFRKYSKTITGLDRKEYAFVSMDGKALKGSFDNLNDQGIVQIFSAFLIDQDIILAHEKIGEKTNEIPMAQKLVKELGINKSVFTLDALHCQKKR
jgi:hypothetical protein